MARHRLHDDLIERLLAHQSDPLVRVSEQEQGVARVNIEELPRTLGDDDLSLGADLGRRGVLAQWGRLIHVHADLLVGATRITSGTNQEVTSRHVVDQRVRSVQLVGKNLRKIRWENGWEMRGHGWGTLSPDLVLPTWSLFLPLPCLYMRCGDQHLA